MQNIKIVDFFSTKETVLNYSNSSPQLNISIRVTFLWCRIFLSCQIYIYIYFRGKNRDVFRLKRSKKVLGGRKCFTTLFAVVPHAILIKLVGKLDRAVGATRETVSLLIVSHSVCANPNCALLLDRIEPAYSVCLTFRAHTPNTLIDRIYPTTNENKFFLATLVIQFSWASADRYTGRQMAGDIATSILFLLSRKRFLLNILYIDEALWWLALKKNKKIK